MLINTYFLSSLAWIISCISFYALGLNSSLLSGHIVFNFFLARVAGSSKIFYMLMFANSIGRRRSLSLAYLILGICCFILAFVPKDYDNVILAFYLIGTIVASASM